MVRVLPRGNKQIAVDEQSNFYVLAGVARLCPPDDSTCSTSMIAPAQGLLEFGTEGSGETAISESARIGLQQWHHYIADTGNNRIVRYQLSTDTRQ